ncbi:MAG: hypothetical protein J3Q66DRAFT_91246 [Benniella sp.]|nr:MAG: hypothetical protein J3Q66DRAFT_91246 [Benniella sp.]
MGFKSNGVLKLSLWLQAASLLVLTSLLAISSAWIGATLTVIGFCFVIIGMGAAHKKNLGYLYCYATLISAWTLLAVAHVMAILQVISIPVDWFDPVLVMGQKIVQQNSHSTIIIITSVYGLQILAWACSLISLICVRSAALADPTLGFEIQSPKRRSTPHTIASKKSRSSSQRFFGFRHSSVTPLEPTVDGPAAKDPHGAKTLSEKGLESGSICVPNSQRISVVTFKDDKPLDQTELASVLISNPLTPNQVNIIEARRVMIQHDYNLGTLVFEKTEESLSDIISKVVQPSPMDKASKGFPGMILTKESNVRVSHESDRTDGDTKAESPTLSLTTTLDEFAIQEKLENDLAVKEPKDLDMETPQEQQGQQAWTQKGHVTHTSSPPVIPTRRSSIHHKSHPRTTQEPQVPLPTVVISHHEPEEEKPSHPQNDDDSNLNGQSGHNSSTEMEPTSHESHPCSTDSEDTKLQLQPTSDDAHDTLDEDDLSSFPNPEPSSPSIQPLFHRGHHMNDSVSSTPRLAAMFAKRHSSPALFLPPAFTIPTIVLHPDADDNEPVRVLTDMDIEYLSMMPPVPLRPLVPSWDDEEEGEYYDDDFNDGYDYDEYDQRFDYAADEVFDQDGRFNLDHDNTQFLQDEEMALPKGSALEGEFDPYALDVPINIAIDLQALTQTDTKVGYGYI